MLDLPRRPCLALIALLLGGSSADGQVVVQSQRSDLPVIRRIVPSGVERGRTAELTLHGERLAGFTDILCPAGLKLVEVLEVGEKQARLRVHAPSNAPLGIHSLHALSSAGLSNPRLLRIDHLPQFVEEEDNGGPESATPLAVPAAVTGFLAAAERDFFRFEATAGQRLVFDVAAQRLGSALRPVLTLYDARGRELRTELTPPPDLAPDTRLTHTFARAGTYFVSVHDLTYAGADFAVYCLRIAKLPYAISLFPLGGRRGDTARVTLSGGNLDSPLAHDVPLTADVLPRVLTFHAAGNSGTVTAPARFAVGDFPEAVESEPNDAPEEADGTEIPVTLNGRIGRARDRDSYRLRLAKDENLHLRVLAAELGSPLDAVITIRDAAGRVLKQADDQDPQQPREPPVIRAVTPLRPLDDPRLDFAAPAEGEYVVTVEDRYRHGGEAFAYRLEIAPPRRDFDLVMQPGRAEENQGQRRRRRRQRVLQEFAGGGTAALSLDRGGSARLAVRVFRDGYNGPIDLRVEGLPPGVTADEVTIPEGSNQANLRLLADFEAAPAAAFARLVGTARIDGRQILRLATQPVYYTALRPNGACRHDHDFVAVGVSRRGAELALRGRLDRPLAQGGRTTLSVQLRRREGVQGDVRLDFIGLPTGISASPVTIEAAAHQVEIPLTAIAAIEPGPRKLRLQGTLQPADKKGEPILAEATVALDVVPLVALELGEEQVELPRGGTVLIPLRLQRHAGPVPVELELSRLPKGVEIASPLTVPPDADIYQLKLSAADTARPSAIRRIIQLKAQARLDDTAVELPTHRFALKIARP